MLSANPKGQPKVVRAGPAAKSSRLTTNLGATRFLRLEKIEPKKPHPLFTAFVHASAIFIYVHLSAIAYLVFRVFCIQHTSKKTSRRSTGQQNSVTDAESNSTETFGILISIELTNRQSRFRVRRTLDFGTKTLSKIKSL